MYFPEQHFSLKQTSAPSTSSVTTAELKTFARIEGTDEDTPIQALLYAADEHAQVYLRRQLVTATWRLSLDYFPDEFYLPRSPLASVSSITYVGTTEGTWDTLATTEYTVDTDSEPGRIWPSYDAVWPIPLEVPQAVKVVFVAGYGAYTAVPAGITNAIKWLVAWWLENREAMDEIPKAFYTMLEPFRVGDE